MDRPHLRFVLALSLFAVWVLGLGAMALVSADRPQVRSSLTVPR
jgi:hypothetical protein